MVHRSPKVQGRVERKEMSPWYFTAGLDLSAIWLGPFF
jgi:hypothetical protein